MRRSNHAPGSVRHVEKRRTGTCRFADRIAQLSLAAYRSSVPQSFRDHQKQTCVATIVAHFASDGHLQVIGLGVGTKFLSEAVLHAEETNSYGTRVRDCHAEVLARRAFRRQLCLELEALSQSFENESIPESYRPILRLSCDGTDADLVDDVTLHFYSSSAPCGNATLKKFTKMERETYNDELGPNVWPEASHDPIPGHSLKLGQFALLIKKDTVAMNAVVEKPDDSLHQPHPPQNVREWPANQSDDWCPPGTSIVAFRKGSLHTCSDKICRWNYLGLQGSLLASVLKTPLYMSTIIVGRKLTACICRRAVCCRAEQFGKAAGKRQEIEIERDSEVAKYALHHPTVMGTGVYMDDVGVIDMTDAHKREQDLRFDSTLAWVWWPFMEGERDHTGGSCSGMAECIDGATGFIHNYFGEHSNEDLHRHHVSLVSTAELLRLFSRISNSNGEMLESSIKTLRCLRAFKRHVSPEYETAKDKLLSKHRIFRQWRRREYDS